MTTTIAAWSARRALVTAIQADNAAAAAVVAAVDETVARLGGLDILVNNAGVAQVALIEEMPLDE